MMLVLRDAPRAGRRPAPARDRLRRGVRGGEGPRLDALVADGFTRRVRDHRRAHQPSGRGAGEGRAGDAGWASAGARRTARRRGWATTRSSRRSRCFRAIESLPFARQSSELFDRPSINLGRIWGGDALNQVPDSCVIDVDVRFLPEQDPDEILEQVGGLPDTRADHHLPPPARRGRGGLSLRPRPLRGGLAAPPRAGDERRPRRRLRRGLLPAASAFQRSSSAPSARATTARASGSRSARCAATARRWRATSRTSRA